ncbi:hypothetical protein PILCRDRAFT_13028 [Piloderma croceum F 1598]|uniref:CHAT domain-containing protein n=1 Tax=Piloderma croceum (strain F 1598) TaxID=765440 RepID=A0A0C3EUD5_PILCF|nr:hypothetical protein PILCRDRAFT_13028 [Piloderma croceum F 1598]
MGHGDQLNTKDIGKERCRLVGEWEGLVESVRRLPLFKYFLRPIPFHQLRQASSGGQVIIINSSVFGVDALVFGTVGPIERVPLPDIDFPTLTELTGNILPERATYGSATQRRNHTKHFLIPALRTIWSNILADIIEKIHIPLVDPVVLPQHRIWWYLTGPLTFVPIHAAGPGSKTIDVSQLVVSSYVTTLRSLFDAHQRCQRASKKFEKLLSVGQSQTPGQSSLPHTTEEVKRVVHMFCSSGWLEENVVCLRGSEATVDRVSSALDLCSWIHFACHGFQDAFHGMKCAFVLHDGLLEVEKIASKRLSNGQFAFLSTCQAASGLKHLPGESMHLAAGLQFVGFPSIVATMWNICDDDALMVAEETYGYLFRNGIQALDPSKAAMALNRAILCLREDPSVTVDRWAPFVHFGI